MRKPPDKGEKTAKQKQAEVHLANARRASSPLKALAEAQTAYRLDPRNPKIRVFFGQILVKTGSKDRGCKILKRYKRRWRAAGCAD